MPSCLSGYEAASRSPLPREVQLPCFRALVFPLVALSKLLWVGLFVIAPLHAAGIVISQDVGLAVALVVIVTVLFAYGMSAAVFVMLVGFGLAVAAAVLRHRNKTPLDLCAGKEK